MPLVPALLELSLIKILNVPFFLSVVHSRLAWIFLGFSLFFMLVFSVVQKVQGELDSLKKDLDKVSVKTQEVLASPQPSTSAPVLRSELDLTVQKMAHAHILSSVYLEK